MFSKAVVSLGRVPSQYPYSNLQILHQEGRFQAATRPVTEDKETMEGERESDGRDGVTTSEAS